MCGIAGFYIKSAVLNAQEAAELAQRMADSMTYRGPDDSGIWSSADGKVVLAQRRLSIIDTSSAGHQPMVGKSARDGGQIAVTYNGELYNFRELQTELENLGRDFSTRSDTEVLLAALDQWGTGAFGRLDSMFALAFYDESTGTLLLGRDMFGEKPLYYVETDDFVAFASELHALALVPGFDPVIDHSTIAAYFSFQYVPSPKTIYRNARKLPPGCWLRVKTRGDQRTGSNAELATHRYFDFRTSNQEKSSRSLDDLADELESVLVSTINRRLISDVPLGAFLSGGVDSSTIAAISTRRLGIPLDTFSIGFAGHADSEHFDAAQIAKHLGTTHFEKVLDPDAIHLGEHIGSVLDEPNGDTSCLPTFLLSEFARKRVTVALSGDGGDELFGGYGRYFVTADEWQRKRNGDESLAWWNSGAVYLSSRILVFPDDELEILMGRIPGEFAAMLNDWRTAIDEDERPLINIMRELDAHTYMPGAVLAKVDRMAMQHSLETRAPFLGIDVARFAMTLAADDCYQDGQGKLVLKRIAERYLPADWVRRPKRGFGLPMDIWGADVLMPVIDKMLLGDDCRLAGWIDRKHIHAYVEHLRSSFQPYRAWELFILETWLRTHPSRPA